MPRQIPRDIFFDYHLFYEGTEIDSVVEDLWELMEEQWKGERIRDKESHIKSLKVLVLNLFNAYRVDVNMPVGIPQSSNFYSKSPLGYKATKRVQDMLIQLGYVKLVRKGINKAKDSEVEFNKAVKPRTSAYKSTKKLHNYFGRLNLYSLKINLDSFNSIRVGNKKTGNIEHEVNDTFMEMKKSLREINKYYDSIHIDLFVTDGELTTIRRQMSHREVRDEWLETKDDMILKDLNFRRKYLHRKFYDNTYKLHGRFYGGFWEGIPSEWRKRITINGRPTVELDFTNMHFAMLYHEIGEKMLQTGDLYDLSPFLPDAEYTYESYPSGLPQVYKGWKDKTEDELKVYRNQVKLIMNYMLNCEDDEQVKAVIQKNRKKHFNRCPTGFTWQSLIDFIKEVHSPIADKFYRNQGLRLMNLDSQVVEKVIHQGIKNDVCVLGVHDSCICKFEHQGKVLHWMLQAYKEVIGKYGKGIKFDQYDIDFEAPVETLKDADITSYLNRLQEWNWHRQPYGDSSLPLIAPMP
tara:strand:- start:742 stop:2301 length:1560 start_codon:yes stop_codon:yes gene_type:complete